MGAPPARAKRRQAGGVALARDPGGALDRLVDLTDGDGGLVLRLSAAEVAEDLRGDEVAFPQDARWLWPVAPRGLSGCRWCRARAEVQVGSECAVPVRGGHGCGEHVGFGHAWCGCGHHGLGHRIADAGGMTHHGDLLVAQRHHEAGERVPDVPEIDAGQLVQHGVPERVRDSPLGMRGKVRVKAHDPDASVAEPQVLQGLDELGRLPAQTQVVRGEPQFVASVRCLAMVEEKRRDRHERCGRPVAGEDEKGRPVGHW